LIQNSLAIRLTLDVAKVFDVGLSRPLDDQDKASIPILAHYLARSDVRYHLLERARAWTPHYPEQGAAALERVRGLRHRRLAHSLFDKEPDPLPRYNDLFDLL
jgi:hypothetical protein